MGSRGDASNATVDFGSWPEKSGAFGEAAAPIRADAGGFFASVLDRLRRRLAQLGARRYVDQGGYEHWDLKPDWKPGDVVTL